MENQIIEFEKIVNGITGADKEVMKEAKLRVDSLAKPLEA